jgi:hypothetical protein
LRFPRSAEENADPNEVVSSRRESSRSARTDGTAFVQAEPQPQTNEVVRIDDDAFVPS